MRKLLLTLVALLTFNLAPAQAADFGKAAAAYRNGDWEAAFQEWKLLAEQGDPSGQRSLGLMYANGEGVQRNYRLAYMWLYVAGLNGVDQAFDIIDNLSDEMTLIDIGSAQAMTRKCQANAYKNCGY